jgi:hypothetical protein
MAHGIEGWRIEGLAIVSADGMIANAQGVQPEALKIEADQRFFHDHLQAAQAFAHGRNSGSVGDDLADYPRLVLTRRVDGVAPHPRRPGSVRWNPAGASLRQALDALGLSGGTLAVIGGTNVFGQFLEFGFDVFHLSVAAEARLPGGRPVFPGVPAETPQALLARHGLRPDPSVVLDEAAELTLTSFRR